MHLHIVSGVALNRLSEEMECGVAVYQRVCGNEELANKFRALAVRAERMGHCVHGICFSVLSLDLLIVVGTHL